MFSSYWLKPISMSHAGVQVDFIADFIAQRIRTCQKAYGLKQPHTTLRPFSSFIVLLYRWQNKCQGGGTMVLPMMHCAGLPGHVAFVSGVVLLEPSPLPRQPKLNPNPKRCCACIIQIQGEGICCGQGCNECYHTPPLQALLSSVDIAESIPRPLQPKPNLKPAPGLSPNPNPNRGHVSQKLISNSNPNPL